MEVYNQYQNVKKIHKFSVKSTITTGTSLRMTAEFPTYFSVALFTLVIHLRPTCDPLGMDKNPSCFLWPILPNLLRLRHWFPCRSQWEGHRTWYTIQLSVENRMSNIGNIYYINEIQDSVEIIIMAQWQSITQILTRSSCGSVIKANGISQSKPGLRVVQTKLLPFTCKFRLYMQAHLSLHNEGDHHVKGLNYTAFNVIRVSWYCQTTELQYVTSQWISEFQLSSRKTHSAPSLSKNNKQHQLTVASCRVLCSQDQQRTPVSCDWWGPSSHEGNYSIHAHLINFNITFHINLNQFSALTLLVGRQEGHPACKKTGCWWWRFDWSFARLIAQVVQLSPLPPSSFASINTG